MMTKTEIDQLTRQIYEEYIFGGTGRPTYGIDFDKRHILQALEMMVHKTNEYWLTKNLHKPPVMRCVCDPSKYTRTWNEDAGCDVCDNCNKRFSKHFA